jgi:hypothetical protein
MIPARAAPFKARDRFELYRRFLFSTEPRWISIDFDKMIYPANWMLREYGARRAFRRQIRVTAPLGKPQH